MKGIHSLQKRGVRGFPYKFAMGMVPKISGSERAVLNAGKIDNSSFATLENYSVQEFTDISACLDKEVNEICDFLHDYKITAANPDLINIVNTIEKRDEGKRFIMEISGLMGHLFRCAKGSDCARAGHKGVRAYSTGTRKSVIFDFKAIKVGESPEPTQRICMQTLAELLSWARKRSIKFADGDLEIRARQVQQDGTMLDIILNDEESFKALCTDTVYELNIKSLSKPFSSFLTYESVREYAQLAEDFFFNPALSHTFPEIEDKKKLQARGRTVYTDLVDFWDNCGNEQSAAMYRRELISPIWRQAVVISNAELAKGTSIDTNLNRLKYKYETPIAGKRARGALDMVMYVKYFIFLLVEAKNTTIPVTNHKYQALAQLVAVRERAVRHYIRKHPLLSEAQVKAAYDKFPSIGVVSSGEHWLIFQYYMDSNGNWRAEQSQIFYLMRVSRTSGPERILLKQQIQLLLKHLSGASMLVHQQAHEFEKILTEMNAELLR